MRTARSIFVSPRPTTGAWFPHQPDPTGPIEWETIKADGQGSLAVRTSRKLVNAGSLGVAYAAELLHGLLSEDGVLSSMWADGYTTVNALWDAFARYPYLPRLKNLETLCATVRQGANPIAWQIMGFAVAEASTPPPAASSGSPRTGMTRPYRDDTGRPPGRRSGRSSADEASSEETSGANGGARPAQDGDDGDEPAADDTLRRFYAVARLDPERYQRDFAKLAAEVIANLAGLLGTNVEISRGDQGHEYRRVPGSRHPNRHRERAHAQAGLVRVRDGLTMVDQA